MRSLLLPILAFACSGEHPAPMAPPTVAVSNDGPVGIVVPAFEVSTDPAVVARGEAVYRSTGCGACHQFGTRLVGPDLTGVTQRRTSLWIARQIVNPERMTREDPVARQLFTELKVQMTNQQVPAADIGPLISYLNSKSR